MSLMTPPTPPPTAEPFDWIDAPDGKLYELIDGRPVEKHVSVTSIWIATRISFVIGRFLEVNDLGFVLVEQPVLGVWGRPKHGRRPDVCYVSRTTLPALPPEGDLTNVVPDLIAEVISPNDSAEEVEVKLQEYLAAGVKVLWVVYPQPKIVRVHHADGAMRMLNITGTLDGGPALPGFTCPVMDIFPKT